MLKYKFMLIFFVAGIFSFAAISYAMVATQTSGGSTQVNSTAGMKLQKKTVIVKKIDSNALYTFNDQKIDLYHVKVSNFTSRSTNTSVQKTITAELLYIDGVLKEAVIRER